MPQGSVTDIMLDGEVEAAVSGSRRRRRLHCIVCQREFECVRSDATTCSPLCRQHLRRARLGTWTMGLGRLRRTR